MRNKINTAIGFEPPDGDLTAAAIEYFLQEYFPQSIIPFLGQHGQVKIQGLRLQHETALSTK